MSDSPTDRLLVERVQAGDQRAFELLFARYQHRLHVLVSRYVQDSQEVEDVVQDAFIKAWRALPGFRGESAFYTWLYRIAVNTAKNYLASRARRPPSADVAVEDAELHGSADALRESATPGAELGAQRLQGAISDAISALPEDLRTAVTLREFDGLSYEAISEIMECPVGTVRSRIFRARESIDQHIGPLLERASATRAARGGQRGTPDEKGASG